MAVSKLGRKPDCSARRIGPVSIFESIGSIESVGSIVHTGNIVKFTYWKHTESIGSTVHIVHIVHK